MKKLPYGESNFEEVITGGYYYIDKTQYINKLENADSKYIFLLRPRRFGKSLFVSMLECYYDIYHKERFQELFGQLYIGKNPTPNANAYHILKFEFSGIDTTTPESTYNGFLRNIKSGVSRFLYKYRLFDEQKIKEILDLKAPNLIMLDLFDTILNNDISISIYVLIDEYDHFANELLAFRFNEFQDIVSKNGYVRKFYETLKTAAWNGIISRFFATGVTPVTLDSMTSGFNIARNFSTSKDVNEAIGFTQNEVEQLLVDVAKERGFSNFDAKKVKEDLKNWYNGYLFSEDATERIYNSDMILFFISDFSVNRFTQYPKDIIDTNVASDYGKIQQLFEIGKKEENYKLIEKIVSQDETTTRLTSQFNFERDFTRYDFMSLLYYMGYLSIYKPSLLNVVMRIPNFVIKSLFYDFFVEKIKHDASLDVQRPDIYDIIVQLANKNTIQPLINLIEHTLQALSNRDFVQFDEKYIKLLFVAYGNAAGFYYVKSEPEIDQKYPDVMFLYRPPYYPNYQFVFELKYLKKTKTDAKNITETTNVAKSQLQQYLQSKELQDFVVRPEAGMETVKAYIVVFVGEKAEVVEEVYSLV